MSFWNTIIGGISLLDWGFYLLLSVVGYFVLKLIIQLLVERVGRSAEKTSTDLDDFLIRLLRGVRNLVIAAMSLWGMKFFFPVEPKVESGINLFALMMVFFQLGVFANVVIEYILNQRLNTPEKQTKPATIQLMAKIISWFVWAVLLVMALDSIPGFNANTLITTLGVGGIAIAFALQSVLADVASALTIAFDQPFEVGDGVVVDDLGGTIETIGLKSTRIRSWDGQEVICSNSDLLKSRINNYKNMERRRVMLKFGVVYDTSAGQLEHIPARVESIVSSVADTEFVWCYFTELGASSLQFQAMYWVNSTDFNVFLKARHAVHLAMVKQFEQEGIAFAYPTQTVFLAHSDAEQALS